MTAAGSSLNRSQWLTLTPSDIDQYLPEHTMQLCTDILHNGGFSLPVSGSDVDDNRYRLHPQAYMHLRYHLYHHLQAFNIDEMAPLDNRSNWRPQPDNMAMFEAAGEPLFEGPGLDVDITEPDNAANPPADEEFDDDDPQQYGGNGGGGGGDDEFMAQAIGGLQAAQVAGVTL